MINANNKNKCIKIILHNGNPTFKWDADGNPEMNMTGDVKFSLGDRIAQLVVRKSLTTDSYNVITFNEVDEVVESVRGASGFGSSGMK